jgi:hypothetical protein
MEKLAYLNTGRLTDAQLDEVAGGWGPETILKAVQTAFTLGMNCAEKIQKLVDSHAYARMSNSDKELALGKCLANDPAFNGLIFGKYAGTVPIMGGGAAVGGYQIKLRFWGVSSKEREMIEEVVRSC